MKLCDVVSKFGCHDISSNGFSYGFAHIASICAFPSTSKSYGGIYVTLFPFGSADPDGVYCDPTYSLNVFADDDIKITIDKTCCTVVSDGAGLYYDVNDDNYDDIITNLNKAFDINPKLKSIFTII